MYTDAFNSLWMMVVVSGALLLVPLIFFLITQMNTIRQIDEENRSIKPGQVWLQLIPFFGLVWQFFVVTRISDSIRRQLYGAPLSTENGSAHERPTYQIGMAYCVLICLTAVPFISAVASLAGIICWITYWVKLHGYKEKMTIIKFS